MPAPLPPPRTQFHTRCENIPYPSIRYGQPYSQDLRELVMAINNIVQQNNQDPAVTQLILTLQNNHVYPNDRTIGRWNDLENQLGHYRACIKKSKELFTRSFVKFTKFR